MSGETIQAAAGGDGRVVLNDKAPRGVKLLLYTEGGITTVGVWQDHSGIAGWSLMPTVDKEELDFVRANPHSGFSKPRNLKDAS